MGYGYAVYFAERARNRVVRWDPDSGETDIVAGGSGSGDRSQSLNDPYGLAFDPAGILHVSDKLGNRICRIRQGRLEPLSFQDEDGHRARKPESSLAFDPRKLASPASLHFEKSGCLLCAFYDDETLYRIHPGGRLELVLGVVKNLPYFHDPPRDHVPLSELRSVPLAGPTGVVSRSDGTLFFIERSTQTVREYHPSRELRSLFPSAQAGVWFRKSEAPLRGRFEDYHPLSPEMLALDGSATLHLCDNLHSAVLRLDVEKGSFERVLYSPRGRDSFLDGGPQGLTFAPDGTVWVADSVSQTIQSYAVKKDGTWTPSSSRLEKVLSEPLRLTAGGMGMVVGH